jgi:SAM-dependent methyltransferase
MMVTVPYQDDFYEFQAEGSVRSAEAMLDVLWNHFRPASVIDVGCGRGTWLHAALERGATRAVGLDGEWVSDKLIDPRIEFQATNLAEPFAIPERFDLAMSLEVAEHLPESRAQGFIQALCASADVVIFGAATKLQGGTGHQNEQWQSFWVMQFEQSGLVCVDLFRQSVWGNAAVEWWYQQNAFLFVRAEVHPELAQLRERFPPRMLDVVHPGNFTPKVSGYHRIVDEPDLGFCLSILRRYVVNKIRSPHSEKGRDPRC